MYVLYTNWCNIFWTVIYYPYICSVKHHVMSKPFIYGMSVEGENFTDRNLETQRLKLNFENGINSILISPRRMGKTSLVKKVIYEMDNPKIVVVYMDIYKCRTEYEFYEKFASSVIQATATRMEQMLEMAKEFVMSITPKITYSPEPGSGFSLSLGISKQGNSPEEILNLPERIAAKHNINIVVCIDEFQQIGEFADSITVQKTIRSVWQHQRLTSYCLFGSKKHLMSEMFYSRNLPFYQFGDMFFLKKIETKDWVPFIIERFRSSGKQISAELAEKICTTVDNYSAYVQQLAWNVLAMSGDFVDETSFANGLEATLAQVMPLFVEQTNGLTTYQLNFIRAICSGFHRDFSKKEVTSLYNLGTRSNLPKIQSALIEREIIDRDTDNTYFLADPLFEIWFKREMM